MRSAQIERLKLLGCYLQDYFSIEYNGILANFIRYILVSVHGPLPQPAWFRHDSLTSSVTLEEYSEAYALLYSNRSEARMKLQDFRGAADDGDEALKFLKALAALSGLNEETQALRRTRLMPWGSGDAGGFCLELCIPGMLISFREALRYCYLPNLVGSPFFRQEDDLAFG